MRDFIKSLLGINPDCGVAEPGEFRDHCETPDFSGYDLVLETDKFHMCGNATTESLVIVGGSVAKCIEKNKGGSALRGLLRVRESYGTAVLNIDIPLNVYYTDTLHAACVYACGNIKFFGCEIADDGAIDSVYQYTSVQ